MFSQVGLFFFKGELLTSLSVYSLDISTVPISLIEKWWEEYAYVRVPICIYICMYILKYVKWQLLEIPSKAYLGIYFDYFLKQIYT